MITSVNIVVITSVNIVVMTYQYTTGSNSAGRDVTDVMNLSHCLGLWMK